MDNHDFGAFYGTIDDYRLYKTLGEGQFGKVKLATRAD